MYDGTVGVLGGLEALRSLKEAGFQPKRSLELLMFTSEEPTRFGIGCIGSRLLGGVIDPQAADGLPDRLHETDPNAREGMTLRDVREAAGFSGPLAGVKLPEKYYDAWVELHIEQGPLLERDGIQLGIVTNIAAPASYRYTVEGFGGHAGALLMPDRRDALCAAAEITLSVERHALAANAQAKADGQSGVDTVATVGMVSVHPGAVNSVPSRVQLTLDIRDTDVSRRDSVMDALHADIRKIERRRGVRVTEQLINTDRPAHSDRRIIAALEDACKEEDASFRRMVARAYHDTSFIAAIAPVAMLFIPCRNGVSHRPDEYAAPEAIALGTRVLARTLAKLSIA
jgi:N-carbamoyl-L-amino-acid hydrolase